jgi:YVTN family beta-propeller protein
MHARQVNAIFVTLALVFGVTLVFLSREVTSQLPPAVTRFAGPTASQPLALTGDDSFLLVVNPDNNTLTAFDVRADRNRKLIELPVQGEPNGVAVLPDGTKAYVANTVSGTVTAFRLNLLNGSVRLIRHIPVGTEPYGVALTPNGRKLYVSNARSNNVSVIDTATDAVIKTIANVGVEPRGIAISNNGDGDDNDETVYVTQFLAAMSPDLNLTVGSDDAKLGQVTVISTATDSVVGTVTLNPVADTGFKANGNALARIPPGALFNQATGAYPNQLNNVAILGGFAFVASTGASPNGPVRFDVNTQSLLSVINRATNADANATLNMQKAVQDQLGLPRTFITVPWAMAFKHTANDGYVVSAASDLVIKLAVNPMTGAAAVQSDPVDPTRVLQIATGKNPRGIVINSIDTRAYIMNYVSRDVTVIDLTGPREAVMEEMRSAALPTAGTLADTIQIGKELYNTSLGEFDPATPGGTTITRRMSGDGWGSCAACHPNGLSDGVPWIVDVGPRRSIAQHATFDQADPTRATQRALNWSATFDEIEDFELFIRNVSGGDGLIVLPDGVTPDPNVAAFNPANGGRTQLKIRGVGAWDALKAYVQFGIRSPISPVSKTEPQVLAGSALFRAANCQQCHGGPQWTRSRVRYTPPASPGIVVNGQIISELVPVGTFDPNAFFLNNEVRANGSTPPLGAAGYNTPSLLGVFLNRDSFFHGGAARSLDEVLQNVTHRSAGTGGVDTLSNAADRAAVVRFLQSIDAASVPIP